MVCVGAHVNIDADVEDGTSRVTVMNPGILKRSVGIGANTFPKKYKVKGTWTVWVLVLVGLVAVISPKIIVPLIYGKEVWQVSIWNGFYQPFIALYACLVCCLLAFKIPTGLVREADGFIVEFFCRKIRIELSDVDEVRVVRKWKFQDSAKQIADAAPEFVGPCIGAAGKGYEEVGAPKQKLKAVPFSLCDLFSCTSKIYWGAPSKSKEVCIISLKNSTYGNFMLDLSDLDGFIRDNRADYSNVTPNGVPPQILGAKSIDEKKGFVASPASTTASASPLSSLASPMSDCATPVAGVANPMFTVGASGLATQFETLAEELSSGEESPRDSDDAGNSI